MTTTGGMTAVVTRTEETAVVGPQSMRRKRFWKRVKAQNAAEVTEEIQKGTLELER